MPPTRLGSLQRTESAIAVSGLAQLQRALKSGDRNLARNLRRELREIANDIRDTARAGVGRKTGRHGGSGVELGPSIKSRLTQQGASVFSDAPHSIVQDVGGQVGNTTVLRRADVSRYMTEAVDDARPYVARRLEGLLDELGKDFER